MAYMPWGSLMLAIERLSAIEAKFSSAIEHIILVESDCEALRLVLYLKDGTNLRVAEQWEADRLKRYSYYWLTSDNELKIGWDNAPHHTSVNTFPHHKHVQQQKNIQPSKEICLEDVLHFISMKIF